MKVTEYQRKENAHGGYVPTVGEANPGFRFLKQVAADLSKGEISFPTFIDAALKVRRALNDPQIDAARVAHAVSAEPLLAARIMHVANSAGLGPSGGAVVDLKSAILRVGYTNVQTIATSVAMGQLVVAKDMQPFLRRGEAIWRHSLDVAAIAHLLARKLTKLNPDEALFCGLVHDIGYFYLLSKVSKYPELAQDPVALDEALEEWHAPIGHAVLGAFKLSDAVLFAVAEHGATHYPDPLKKLADVIVAANLLSRYRNPLNRDAPELTDGSVADTKMLTLLEASADELTALVAAFHA